jgi:thymidylate kinase
MGMSLIFITGIAGSGKSTVLDELRSRGYEAYGTDEDGMAHWHDNTTGYMHPKSSIKTEHRTPDFIKNNRWKISRKIVGDLALKAQEKPIFLCGVASNDDEIWDLFSGVFALVVDEATLRQRLSNRTTNDYGKAQHELEQTLEQHANSEGIYKKFGYIAIDATQPLGVVVDSILAQALPQFSSK